MRRSFLRLFNFFICGAICWVPTLATRLLIRVIKSGAISNRDVSIPWNMCHQLGFTKPHSAARSGCHKRIQILVNSWWVEFSCRRQVRRDQCRRYFQMTAIVIFRKSKPVIGKQGLAELAPFVLRESVAVLDLSILDAILQLLLGELSGCLHPICQHSQIKVLGACSIST